MNESEQYYLCYERLLRMEPEAAIEDTPDYRAVAARYPYLAESIRLRKELDRLGTELKSTEERSARSQIRREIKSLANKLKRQNTLVRLHGQSKWEGKYKRRLVIAAVRQRLSRIAEIVGNAVSRLHERGRTRLPPSLFDLRTLYPADRSWLLKVWIRKDKVQVRHSGRVRHLRGKYE